MKQRLIFFNMLLISGSEAGRVAFRFFDFPWHTRTQMLTPSPEHANCTPFINLSLCIANLRVLLQRP